MYVDTRVEAPAAEAAPAPAARTADGRSWFDLAHEAALSGRYGDADEVERALRSSGKTAEPCRHPIARDAITIACFRARGVEGWV